LAHPWEYKIAGDRGILIKFGSEVTEEIFREVVSFEEKILKSDLPGLLETIRSYCTLYISYDPKKTNHEILITQLRQMAENLPLENMPFPKAKVIEIPMVYGGNYGPDLPLLVKTFDMSEEEVIRRHLSHDYLIYITAFLCGAAFFKGSDKIFEIPRKKTPVLLHPEGTVNLANGLGTVFMPLSSPTGWYGIGRSPLRQWYPDRDPPVLIRSGDWIRYRRIDEGEFYKIKKEVDQDRFELKYVSV
jgi:inhibitor of KinA